MKIEKLPLFLLCALLLTETSGCPVMDSAVKTGDSIFQGGGRRTGKLDLAGFSAYTVFKSVRTSGGT